MSVTARLRHELGRLPDWVRWLACLSAARLVIAALLPVLTDEAYHWNFARHLDWGYYDHPPMIAWVIAAGRTLFGDTPLGVRFGPLLCAIGTGAILAMLTRRLYGDRAACWAVLLGFVQPLLFWVAPSATPDSPLLFFWALAMACAWQAIATGRLRWWIAAGLAFGGAMLSKYSAVLLVPSVLGFLIFSKEHRRVLATPGPYLALALAAAAFLPVVRWNAAHDWASLDFQIARRLGKPFEFSPSRTMEFLVVQLAGYLPLLAPRWVKRALQRPLGAHERYLLWCAGPTIAFFFLLSPTRGIPANWTIPAYLALTVGMAGIAESRFASAFASPRRLVLVMTAVYAVGLAAASFSPRLQPDLFAWDTVCREVRERREGMPDRTFYLAFGRNFVGPSQLAFHLREPYRVHSKNLLGDDGMQYDFWVTPRDLEGWDAVVLLEQDDYERDKGKRWREIERRFHSVEPPSEVRVPVPVPWAKDLRFYVARARHYVPR